MDLVFPVKRLPSHILTRGTFSKHTRTRSSDSGLAKDICQRKPLAMLQNRCSPRARLLENENPQRIRYCAGQAMLLHPNPRPRILRGRRRQRPSCGLFLRNAPATCSIRRLTRDLSRPLGAAHKRQRQNAHGTHSPCMSPTTRLTDPAPLVREMKLRRCRRVRWRRLVRSRFHGVRVTIRISEHHRSLPLKWRNPTVRCSRRVRPSKASHF